MKVIFLDIDGVLNVISQGYDEYGSLFHKHFEENLRHIINETGAKIVISSTWRMSGLIVMQEMWRKRNLPGEVIDITPDCAQVMQSGWANNQYYEKVERGHEIQEWLDKNPQVISYVILDDDDDMLTIQQDNFIRCANNISDFDCVDIGYGLTRRCADMAISILNKETHV